MTDKPRNDRHIEYADSYSSREPEHPTVVEVIRRKLDFSGQRTDKRPSESYLVYGGAALCEQLSLDFHEGVNPLEGLNGWLTEDLVAVLRHRFERHQQGPFACAENAEIVRLLVLVQDQMLKRRRARQTRRVSGTQTP